MKFDLNLTSAVLSDMPAHARRAADDGFDGLFVTETTQDPYLALAAARPSDGLDLGTSVALAFPRSPMVTAMAAWELQRACTGRFLLGLGSQVRKHVEQRFSVPFHPPVARLREYVSAVRHIWHAFESGGPCDFHGEFYRIDFLPDAVRPQPLGGPAPQVWLAAFGPAMYRTVGRVADGAFVHPIHTVRYLTTVARPAIAEGLRDAGRNDDCDLSVTVIPVVGTGDEARTARERARGLLAFYCSTPNYRPVLDLHGWSEVGEELHALVKAGQDATVTVPDELVDELCIVADTWADAVRTARERYAGVAERLSFYVPPPPGTRLLTS